MHLKDFKCTIVIDSICFRFNVELSALTLHHIGLWHQDSPTSFTSGKTWSQTTQIQTLPNSRAISLVCRNHDLKQNNNCFIESLYPTYTLSSVVTPILHACREPCCVRSIFSTSGWCHCRTHHCILRLELSNSLQSRKSWESQNSILDWRVRIMTPLSARSKRVD